MNHNLRLSEVAATDERILEAKLDAIRASISHAGEKGRSLEDFVAQLIRSFLPSEYGVSTGFVAFHTPAGPVLSKQLDIIIYDAVRGAPLVRLGSCEIFPIECVLAYIEVKASLRSSDSIETPGDSIEQCLADNHQLRRMRDRRYLAVYRYGSPSGAMLEAREGLAIRGYVFALEGRGAVAKSIARLAESVAEVSRLQQAHIHGVFVGGSGFLYTVASTPDATRTHVVKYTTMHPLLAFRAQLLYGLATFDKPLPEETIDFSQYFDFVPEWEATEGHGD